MSEILIKQTQKKLEELMASEAIQNELNEHSAYYFQKFAPIFENQQPEKIEEFAVLYQSFFNSQVFNGYYIASEILQHETTVIEDGIFTESEGNLIEHAIACVTYAFGEDIHDRLSTDVSRDLITWCIRQQFENIRPIIRQLLFDITIIGMKYRFIEERNIRGLQEKAPISENECVASPEQTQYILPDTMIYNTLIGPTEVWDIYRSPTYPIAEKIGDVTIIEIPGELKEYKVVITMNELLSDYEKQLFSTNMIARIQNKGIIEKDRMTVTVVFATAYFEVAVKN